MRTAIVLQSAAGSSTTPAVYFADQRTNLYSVDATSGKLIWKENLADHPAAMITAAPQLHDGVLYVGLSSYEEVLAGSPTYACCTFRGSVTALDAASGKKPVEDVHD